jgi:TetR/AcrR family transcriptional regulator, regulator of cefoperazone and chloramphenicol sensitivity
VIIKQVYRILFVRSIKLGQDDLTTKARLRETALALFADRGIAATSLRSIAAAAGVSAGLVIHHFGSKDGLRRAVDAVVVKRITAALSEVPTGSSGASLIDQRAEVLARVLRPQPALLQYIAQALSESGAAAGELFTLLYATASADQALADAGVIRADSDPFWRALQQLVLIVGPLLLRPLVEQRLGGSLFEPGNFERWMRANADLLKNGLYTPRMPSTPERTESPTAPEVHRGQVPTKTRS